MGIGYKLWIKPLICGKNTKNGIQKTKLCQNEKPKKHQKRYRTKLI